MPTNNLLPFVDENVAHKTYWAKKIVIYMGWEDLFETLAHNAASGRSCRAYRQGKLRAGHIQNQMSLNIRTS